MSDSSGSFAPIQSSAGVAAAALGTSCSGEATPQQQLLPPSPSASATTNDNLRSHDDNRSNAVGNRSGSGSGNCLSIWARHSRQRQRLRGLVSSKQKHYLVMALVVADVSVILSDIFVALIACDMHLHDGWVDQVHEAMKIIGLVFSSLFLLELLLSVWAWGIRFFYSWFHCFDALVIVASFIIEVLTHGVLEEIASIVVILRLLRFVKIVDEISLGASERLESVDARAAALERENAELKRQLAASGV